MTTSEFPFKFEVGLIQFHDHLYNSWWFPIQIPTFEVPMTMDGPAPKQSVVFRDSETNTARESFPKQKYRAQISRRTLRCADFGCSCSC